MGADFAQISFDHPKMAFTTYPRIFAFLRLRLVKCKAFCCILCTCVANKKPKNQNKRKKKPGRTEKH